jgi:hypothetical protein
MLQGVLLAWPCRHHTRTTTRTLWRRGHYHPQKETPFSRYHVDYTGLALLLSPVHSGLRRGVSRYPDPARGAGECSMGRPVVAWLL